MRKKWHPNRLLKFKDEDDAWTAEWNSYNIIHCGQAFILFKEGLSKDEIESALYGQFIEDRIKERKYIQDMEWLGLAIVKKIMKRKNE